MAVPPSIPRFAAAFAADEPRQPQYGLTAMNRSRGHVGAIRSQAATTESFAEIDVAPTESVAEIDELWSLVVAVIEGSGRMSLRSVQGLLRHWEAPRCGRVSMGAAKLQRPHG